MMEERDDLRKQDHTLSGMSTMNDGITKATIGSQNKDTGENSLRAQDRKHHVEANDQRN